MLSHLFESTTTFIVTQNITFCHWYFSTPQITCYRNYDDCGSKEEATIDTELRDSLLPGITGKFAQVQSSWEVLPDGTRRFLSAIIYGK